MLHYTDLVWRLKSMIDTLHRQHYASRLHRRLHYNHHHYYAESTLYQSQVLSIHYNPTIISSYNGSPAKWEWAAKWQPTKQETQCCCYFPRWPPLWIFQEDKDSNKNTEPLLCNATNLRNIPSHGHGLLIAYVDSENEWRLAVVMKIPKDSGEIHCCHGVGGLCEIYFRATKKEDGFVYWSCLFIVTWINYSSYYLLLRPWTMSILSWIWRDLMSWAVASSKEETSSATS